MGTLKNNSLIVILLAFLLTGCGTYTKMMKDPDPAKRYKAAMDFYNKGSYAKATPIFETLEIPWDGYPQHDTIKFYIAKGYYLMKDYYPAEAQLSEFIRTFGRSPFVEEAYYLRAANLYRMSLRAELDQRNTIDALTAFSLFHNRYPNSEFGKDDKDYYEELINRLHEKTYISAKLYYQIEDYKAAIVALRNSIKDFPDSKYNEEQSFLILKSSFLYARKSVRQMQPERYISTIDEYYNFISEYPESKYIAEANDIYETSLTFTKKKGIDIKDELDRTID